MSITRINRSVVNGTTVSMVLVDGVYEVAAFANGDEICATVRTTDIDAAERTFAATVGTYVRQWTAQTGVDTELDIPEDLRVPPRLVPDCAGCEEVCCTGRSRVVALRLVDVAALVDAGLAREASDLHLAVGHPPTLRIHGDLFAAGKSPLTSTQGSRRMAQL